MTQKSGRPVKIVLTCGERNRLTAFLSLLIQIDKRINVEKRKTKRPKDQKARKGTLINAGLVLFCISFILMIIHIIYARLNGHGRYNNPHTPTRLLSTMAI